MMKTSVFRSVMVVAFVSLYGCTSIAEKKAVVDDVSTESANVALPQAKLEELEVDPDLPDFDLDAKTLESLLTQYFAGYQGDWTLASSSALNAAITTQDYRVARAATWSALRDNDYDKALKAATIWYDLQPDNERALSTRQVCLIGAGEVEQAIQSFDDNRGDASLDDHIVNIAGHVVQQKNKDSALGVMRHYAKTYADSAQVLHNSAVVAEAFEEYGEAQEWLDQAIDAKPGWDAAAQTKARILFRRGETAEREAFVEQFAKAHPESVSMNISYATILARQERYEEALELMQAVLERNPNDTAALNYSGALAQQLDKLDLAERYYSNVLEQEPGNDEARWSLGVLALIAEKYVTAERLFNEVKAEESFVRAQIQVANARYHTKGLDSALSTLDLLEPVTQADYIDLALARHRLLLTDYKYEEAFGSINEVLLYLPTDFDLLYARALVAAELKKIDIAEADFRAILEQEPGNADVLNALGYTLADQTMRYEEAKALIEKALEIRPDAPHIQDSMGWVLYRLNDYENAIAFLLKAYKENKEVEIGAHLGEVYWETGEKAKAKAIWLEAYEKDNNSPVLNATLQRYDVTFVLDASRNPK